MKTDCNVNCRVLHLLGSMSSSSCLQSWDTSMAYLNSPYNPSCYPAQVLEKKIISYFIREKKFIILKEEVLGHCSASGVVSTNVCPKWANVGNVIKSCLCGSYFPPFYSTTSSSQWAQLCFNIFVLSKNCTIRCISWTSLSFNSLTPYSWTHSTHYM